LKHTGRPLPRLEDRPLLTGDATFVGDLRFAGEVHMRVVRSPVPFGRIRAVETAAARASPGTVAVWTADDIALPPIGIRTGAADGLDAYRQPVLATGVVRYVGEPVAVVFAETAAAAEDAADLVSLEIDPVTPVLDASIRAPVHIDDLRSPDAAVVRKAVGDLDAAFRAGHRVVELRLALARDGGMPLEPRGLAARWDAGRGSLEVFGATRVPHANRDALAAMLDLPETAVVLVATAVGGAFGARGELYPEDVLVAHAARALGRPVRWSEDRREHMIAADQGGGIAATARAAVAGDGAIAGLDVEIVLDQGAYVRTEGISTVDLIAALVPGPYRIGAFRVAAHVRMTNRTPAGTMRGSGAAEAGFIRERLVDAVADALGLDPLEVRRRNFVPPEAMPAPCGVTALGVPVSLDSGRYQQLVDAAAKRFSLDLLRRRAADRRSHGEFVGLGMAFSVDLTGIGPYEHVRLSVDRRGTVEVVTGASSTGQGIETMLAQIVADIVGVEYEAVRVAATRTDRIGHAVGNVLSRGTVMTGTAAQYAAEALRETILDGASRLLGVPADRLMIQGGRVREADRHFRAMLPIGDIARALEPGTPFAEPSGHGLAADGWCRSEAFAVPYALTIVTVEIDPLTGIVRVPRAIIAADVGNAINPQIVEERLAGGLLAGLSSALFTCLPLSPAGMPLVHGFGGYPMPSAAESPLVEVLVTEDAPSPLNPLGLKGIDALGATGIGAAVAAAVDDALATPGFATALPIHPAQVRARIAAMLGARAERPAVRLEA
jgi:CO/xanthine dehydrogenase Mo-binding subunit